MIFSVDAAGFVMLFRSGVLGLFWFGVLGLFGSGLLKLFGSGVFHECKWTSSLKSTASHGGGWKYTNDSKCLTT